MLRHSEHVSRHYDGRLPARFVLAMDTIMHQTYGDECAVWNHEAWTGRTNWGGEWVNPIPPNPDHKRN